MKLAVPSFLKPEIFNSGDGGGRSQFLIILSWTKMENLFFFLNVHKSSDKTTSFVPNIKVVDSHLPFRASHEFTRPQNSVLQHDMGLTIFEPRVLFGCSTISASV